MLRRPPRSTLFPYTTSADLRQPDVILDRDSRAVGGVGGATGVDLEFACHGCPRVPEVMAIDAAYRL